jgi:hypothetical protein
MEDNTLAIELLHQVKANSRKWFIAFIIVLVMFFVSNIAWLYAWNLPAERTVTTYDADSQDNGNAIINESGKVNVNGESN